MTIIFYGLILILGFQVVRVLRDLLKEKRRKKEELEEWNRFNK